MEFETWKTALINEIGTAAGGQAELALVDPGDPRTEMRKKALLDLAEQLRALPPDHATLNALFCEEMEFSNLLPAYGVDHEPCKKVVDVTDRQPHEARVRRHRLFELLGDVGGIARADAEAHQRAGNLPDRVPDLRLELIDVLMLALHKALKHSSKNSKGWIRLLAAPRLFSKVFSQQLGVAVAVLLALSFAMPAAAQKGMGEPTGVARQAVKPPIETMSGTIKDIKTGPCERTTGRSLEGVHLIVQMENGKTINLHLGPAAALEDVLDQLSAGQQIAFEAFRTDAMPQDAYVAKSLKAGDTTFNLRDDNLRPNWAIAAQGGRGGGPGMGAGRGPGQGRGAGSGGGGCYW